MPPGTPFRGSLSTTVPYLLHQMLSYQIHMLWWNLTYRQVKFFFIYSISCLSLQNNKYYACTTSFALRVYKEGEGMVYVIFSIFERVCIVHIVFRSSRCLSYCIGRYVLFILSRLVLKQNNPLGKRSFSIL